MRRVLAACLAVVLLPACASAQTDTVVVTVIDRSSLELTITTTTGGGGFGIPLTGVVGDTLTFAAVAIDTATGDTIGVLLRWESSGPAVVIDAVTGFATYVGGCGQVSCEVTISAFVRQIVSMLIFREINDGTWTEVDSLALELPCVGWGDDGVARHVEGDVWEWATPPSCVAWGPSEPVQLCAYLEDAGGQWFRSPDLCPTSLPVDVGPLPLDVRLGALPG